MLGHVQGKLHGGRDPPLPTNKDIPGTVHNVCQDTPYLWFCPATSQSALDILRDNLDQVSTNLTPLCVPQLFPGKLCAAKFTADCGMYRARVIELRGEDRSSILSRMGEMKRFCCCTEIFDSSIKDKSVASSASKCPGLLACTRDEPIGLMIK